MALITWTASQFAANVGFADDEHKILFDKLNKLYDLAIGGSARSNIGKALDDLIAYVVGHFAHEEKESRYFCDSLFWASQPKQAAKDYATVILLRKPRYPWHNIVPTQQGDRDIVPIVDAAYR